MGSSKGPENEFEVIVIGAGIMGSCSAYEASKRGCSTLLLDQFDLLHNRGSSHGESRTIRITYPEPYYSSMVLQSSRLWEEAQSQVGYKVLYPTHQLDIGLSADLSLQAVISSCRSTSVGFRVLNSSEVAQEFGGGVVLPEDWIGVVSEGAGVIKPTKAVSMFQTLAFRNGAVLKDNRKVTGIRRSSTNGGLVVSTQSGEMFYCKKCVVTAGSWMKKLVKDVTGRDIPIEPLETTICYWKIKKGHDKDYSIGGGFPTFAGYGFPYIYGTPSLEYPGLIKVAVHGGRPCDPDKRTWTPETELMDLLRKWVCERFGGRVEHEGPVSTQSCMYSMTPDEDYVIDFLGEEFGEDVVIAGGFSGHGFKMGPVIGKIVIELVLDGHAEGVEMGYFKLARFDQNPKGNVKGFGEQVGLSSQPCAHSE
ncbi:putative sarcosine oxidase [Silene latifolia]|uniref:putative sarcosine oxidase n=1 Tax=Silene latifolia TaxID=37657 RepID=UPI003D784A3E